MPPITEAKLFEAFGLDPNGANGAQEQNVAAAAAEETTGESTGAQEQNVAASAQDEPEQEPAPETEPTVDTDDPEEPDDGGSEGAEPQKKTLTPEERRANAARRRQQEQQAAVDAAVRAEQEKNAAQLADIFKKAGLKNTITGETITTMEQFNSWYSQFQSAQVEQALKKGQLTPEIMDQLIRQNPVVQQAQQVIEQVQSAQAAQKSAAEDSRVKAELAEIAKLNPEIKEFGDILKMETAPEFRKYIGFGYRAIDAYKLANFDQISESTGRRAAVSAMNNMRGKEHLRATGNSRGGGDVSVPPSQMRMFRALNPGKSDAEITKYYNKHIKNQGG